jgi:hypothetical protein
MQKLEESTSEPSKNKKNIMDTIELPSIIRKICFCSICLSDNSVLNNLNNSYDPMQNYDHIEPGTQTTEKNIIKIMDTPNRDREEYCCSHIITEINAILKGNWFSSDIDGLRLHPERLECKTTIIIIIHSHSH